MLNRHTLRYLRLFPLVASLVNVLKWDKACCFFTNHLEDMSLFSSFGLPQWFIWWCDDPHMWLDTSLWHMIDSNLAQFYHILMMGTAHTVDHLPMKPLIKIVKFRGKKSCIGFPDGFKNNVLLCQSMSLNVLLATNTFFTYKMYQHFPEDHIRFMWMRNYIS